MIKILLTGDNHIGRRYEGRTEKLSKARIDALTDIVALANQEHCDLLVVAGDLFDRDYSISKKSIIRPVTEAFGQFAGKVLVLPGNHDYYTEDSKLWRDFQEEADAFGNILLLNRFEPYDVGEPENPVIVYPAFCQSKHSESNNLQWIKDAQMPEDAACRIGIAHGAIEGLSLDKEGKYFLMTRDELESIPVDAWLIGHTHMPYPPDLSCENYREDTRIFNAGTHVQTDVHCNSEGNVFLIEIDNVSGTKKTVRCKRQVVGKLRFYRETVVLYGDNDQTDLLEKTLTQRTEKIPDFSSVDIILKGTVSQEEYQQRETIYRRVLGRFLEHTVDDSALSELITVDMIRRRYSEISFPAKLLESLLDEPKEVQLLYDLLEDYKDK